MNRVIYILGTGLSINDISEEEWKFLEDKETLGFGGFCYSGIPTKYYMTYEKVNRPLSTLRNKKINYDNNFDIKLSVINEYRNTDTHMFLFFEEDIRYAIKCGFKKITPIIRSSALFLPSRRGWFMNEPEPPHTFMQTRAHSSLEPLFRFRGSLSATVNIALLLRADEIRLVGIDLHPQIDFYQDDPDKWIKNEVVKEVFMNVIMDQRRRKNKFKTRIHEEYDVDEMHFTNVPYYDRNRWRDNALRPMSDVVEWMDKEMRKEGKEGIFCTSKRSVLCDRLEYKGIMEK